MKSQIELQADLEGLKNVYELIDQVLEGTGCLKRDRDFLKIAADEIYSNIIYYAYPGRSGKAWISMEYEEKKRLITIRFKDRGIPYDPLKQPDPDTGLSAEERRVGGLGIYIVKKGMDQAAYEYKNGYNVLTVRKYLA